MNTSVVKIGTSILRGFNSLSTAEIIDIFCKYLANTIRRGDKIVLITSGAVGLGCRQLGIEGRPKNIISLQAAASVGQGYLMSLYRQSMAKYGYNVAQILLTRDDLCSKEGYKNASNTLKKLLEWNVLPIVNENDTISSEELSSGDNDTLSALVATAIQANQLILLTDVDKLYSTDPKIDKKAIPITDVHTQEQIKNLANKNTDANEWGTGGIRTKLEAAKIATASGIKVHLADGRDPDTLEEILNGSRGGTVFHPHPEPLGNRKSWLAHALKPLGEVRVDEGAYKAISSHGASLLLVGIKVVEGIFEKNQPVKISNLLGQELARGLSSLSSKEIENALNSNQKSERSPVVVHRDVLVVTDKHFN